ncbi:MAG TPA: hypothetical protein VFF09_05020 [archaeon]|nr:hypothetical protein [archaeon]
MDWKKFFKPSLRKAIITILLFVVLSQLFNFIFFETVRLEYAGNSIAIIYEIILTVISPFGYFIFTKLFWFFDLPMVELGFTIEQISTLILTILDLAWYYVIASIIDSRLKK